jgi:hypothetical protein
LVVFGAFHTLLVELTEITLRYHSRHIPIASLTALLSDTKTVIVCAGLYTFGALDVVKIVLLIHHFGQ